MKQSFLPVVIYVGGVAHSGGCPEQAQSYRCSEIMRGFCGCSHRYMQGFMSGLRATNDDIATRS